ERQMQQDLNVIKDEMRLPLRRRMGYRFIEPEVRPRLTFECVETLLTLIDFAGGDPRIPRDRLAELSAVLPSLVPFHLRALVKVYLESDGSQHRLFMVLAQTILTRKYVRLCSPCTSRVV